MLNSVEEAVGMKSQTLFSFDNMKKDFKILYAKIFT